MDTPMRGEITEKKVSTEQVERIEDPDLRPSFSVCFYSTLNS